MLHAVVLVVVPEVVTGQFSPATMLVTPGQAATAPLRLTNHAGVATTTAWSVAAPAGVTITPASGTVRLAPGASQSVPLTVTTSQGGLNAPADVSLTTTAAGFPAPDHGDALLTVQSAYASGSAPFRTRQKSPCRTAGQGYRPDAVLRAGEPHRVSRGMRGARRSKRPVRDVIPCVVSGAEGPFVDAAQLWRTSPAYCLDTTAPVRNFTSPDVPA